MKARHVALTCVAMIALSTAAHAGKPNQPGRVDYSSRPIVPSVTYRGPYHYDHASTAAEGYARGMSSVIEARAYHNLLTAQAAIQAAQAQRLQIENREKQMHTYFAMREANRQLRAAERTTGKKPYVSASAKQPATPTTPAAPSPYSVSSSTK